MEVRQIPLQIPTKPFQQHIALLNYLYLKSSQCLDNALYLTVVIVCMILKVKVCCGLLLSALSISVCANSGTGVVIACSCAFPC